MNENKSGEIIRIFPLLIYKNKIGLTEDERISISADVSIVAKNSENIEHLLTPVNKWMKF